MDVQFHRRLQRRRTKDDDDGVVLGASMADPGVVDGTTRVRGKPSQVRRRRDTSHGVESDRRGVETRVQQRRPRHHTQPRCACLEPALGQPWCHEKGAFWKIEKEHDAAAHRLTFNNAFPREEQTGGTWNRFRERENLWTRTQRTKSKSRREAKAGL